MLRQCRISVQVKQLHSYHFPGLQSLVSSIIFLVFVLQVTCSYLQIYQERIYDLLGSEKSGTEVYLREHPKKGVESIIKYKL